MIATPAALSRRITPNSTSISESVRIADGSHRIWMCRAYSIGRDAAGRAVTVSIAVDVTEDRANRDRDVPEQVPARRAAVGPPVPRAEVGQSPRNARVYGREGYQPDDGGQRERQPPGDTCRPRRSRLGRFRVPHRSRLPRRTPKLSGPAPPRQAR